MQSANAAAAVITIHDAPRMTLKGRREVAQWMKEQAEFLLEFGSQYSKGYRSRYMYRTTKRKKKKRKGY